MATQYYVRVLDTTGVPVVMLTTLRKLTYSRMVNAPDTYTLELDDQDGAMGAAFTLDSLVEVWRTDPAASPPIAAYLDLEAFHRTQARQTLLSGLPTYTSYGAGMIDLLARRGIWWPALSPQAAKSGPGESVMKAYVLENAGSGATLTAGRLGDGVTALLTIEPDNGQGYAWSGTREGQGLLDTLQGIALATDLDFGVLRARRPDPLGFRFRVKAYPWGEDRSTQGLTPATGRNAAGNAPVVFAVGFGNMGQPVYSLNRSAEVNAVLVEGQGVQAGRATLEVLDPIAIGASPWNRREAVRNANQEAQQAGLQSAGAAALQDLQARETFSFSVLQTNACRYGRDYFVGDVVTARYPDSVERHYQIRQVDVTVQGGAETIAVTVANVPQR